MQMHQTKNIELAVAVAALVVAFTALALQWFYRPELDKATTLNPNNIGDFSERLNAGDEVYITHIAVLDHSDYIDFELFSKTDPDLPPLALTRYLTDESAGDRVVEVMQSSHYGARVVCNRATEVTRDSNPCSEPLSYRFKVSVQRK